MRRALAAGLALALLCAATPARRDAVTFLEEALGRQQGENWERSGRLFLWTHAFGRGGCELAIERREVQGPILLRQVLPLARVRASGAADGAVHLSCAEGACIEQERIGAGVRERGAVTEVRVLPDDPADRSPMIDAFNELHRLCSDPYGR